MLIPSDMHKWRTKFVWQMAGFAVLSLLVVAGMTFQLWFFRAKFIANPQKMLVPDLGLVFAIVALLYVTFTCINVIISTRKHEAKMRMLEKLRPPLTLNKLRDELQPENQVQFRMATAKLLQSSSPQARAIVEASMNQLVERYRADLGSTPEVEVELAKLEELTEEVLYQASANSE